MAPVVNVLSTSFVAVPALSRVDPVSTSGPTMGLTMTSHVSANTLGGVEHVTRIVPAPSVCARASAARTYGVVPLAAIPTTTSRLVTAAVSIAAAAAITPTTIDGGVPNVGGHSVASSTPSRPDVPAPT